MKKIVSFFLTLVALSVFVPTGKALANEYLEIEDPAAQEAYQVSNIIKNNISYDDLNKKLNFDEGSAEAQGLNKSLSSHINGELSTLSKEEAEETYKEIVTTDVNTQSFSLEAILAAAAKILIKAGLGWLAKKLYD